MEEYRYTFVPRSNSFSFNRNAVQPVMNNMPFTKPTGGFWLSVNNGWEDWCAGEMPDWTQGKMQYEVFLNPDARILNINSEEIFESLPKAYITDSPYIPSVLDYEKLSEKYDAIQVTISEAPVLYRKMYGWDCDSMLVMNPDIIEGFEELGILEFEQQAYYDEIEL